MLKRLRRLGFFDCVEFPSVADFMLSLPDRTIRTDLFVLVLDSTIHNFLVQCWVHDPASKFDFHASVRIFHQMVTKYSRELSGICFAFQ